MTGRMLTVEKSSTGFILFLKVHQLSEPHHFRADSNCQPIGFPVPRLRHHKHREPFQNSCHLKDKSQWFEVQCCFSQTLEPLVFNNICINFTPKFKTNSQANIKIHNMFWHTIERETRNVYFITITISIGIIIPILCRFYMLLYLCFKAFAKFSPVVSEQRVKTKNSRRYNEKFTTVRLQ